MAKPIIKWLLAAVITLVVPVLLWNVWALDYIDQKGKFLAWVLAPVFAFLSAGVIVGMSDAQKPAIDDRSINPFWGWFSAALIIEVVIAALSNT